MIERKKEMYVMQYRTYLYRLSNYLFELSLSHAKNNNKSILLFQKLKKKYVRNV
jgi:hypothetical protein